MLVTFYLSFYLKCMIDFLDKYYIVNSKNTNGFYIPMLI